MKNFSKILPLILCFTACAYLLQGQTFYQAPKAAKKVHKIKELHRSSLKGKSVPGMTCVFNKSGKIISAQEYGHTVKRKNIYTYDHLNRPLSKKEYHGGDLFQTNYSYSKQVDVIKESFRGKTYRICKYYKNGKLIERKKFGKGGEMDNKYGLIERTLYRYNKKDSLISEHITKYGIKSSNRGQLVHQLKTLHYYHPRKDYRTQSKFLNSDGSIRMVREYRYNPSGLLHKTIETYPIEGRRETEEYLYKDGHIWQKIIDDEKRKSVLVYVKGRPIRMRRYLDGVLNGIVDYQYEYF